MIANGDGWFFCFSFFLAGGRGRGVLRMFWNYIVTEVVQLW